MKVLLLFPMADGQTGSAIKYAFEQLGHEVEFVDAKIEPSTSFFTAEEFKPDLVFCSRTYQLTEEVKKIKKRFKDATICMWNVDTRKSIDEWHYLFSLIKLCDYYFVVSSRLIPEWKRINPNTFWLPQGLQNEVYHKPKEITKEDKKRYACDVCWAGHLGGVHQFREPYLNAVSAMGINFKQWGCKANPHIYNENHNKMVALSKINLALSAYPENEKTTSVRNYKILGAGGFCLELYREGIYEIFPPGKLQCFTSPDDLKNKIVYWLNKEYEQERRQIAETGHKWVCENATYTHRILQMCEYMKRSLC